MCLWGRSFALKNRLSEARFTTFLPRSEPEIEDRFHLAIHAPRLNGSDRTFSFPVTHLGVI